MSTSLDNLISKLQEEKDAVQRAKIIYTLHVDKELTLKEISTYLKLHPTYISHYLRIVQLPDIVLDGYYAKQISSAHLFILSRLKSSEDILTAYETILSKNLNTTQTEELIRQIKHSVPTTDNQLNAQQLVTISRAIKSSFPQAEVKIIQTRVKGKVVLELKGESQKTTDFLNEIADKLATREYDNEDYKDMLQVLE